MRGTIGLGIGVLVFASLVLLIFGLSTIYDLESNLRDEDSTDWREQVLTARHGLYYLLASAILALVAFVSHALNRIAAAEPAPEAYLEHLERRLVRRLDAVRDTLDRITEEAAPPSAERPEGAAGQAPEGTVRLGLEDLITDLTHDTPQVRRETAMALRTMGESARDAMGPLSEAMGREDEDLSVLRALVLATLEISGDPDTVVPLLKERLASEDPKIRDWAAVTLGKIGGCAVAAVDDLAEALHDPIIGQTAAEALRRIGGPKADDALRGRRRVKESQDP
jgi:HEAT repeat protein